MSKLIKIAPSLVAGAAGLAAVGVAAPDVKETSQAMTTREGQLTWAAKRAKGMANSVEANERRRRREPPIIDWNDAIANLLDILDDRRDKPGATAFRIDDRNPH